MIETTNPEIDVEELVARVRREAERVRPRENGHRPSSPLAATPLPVVALPPLTDLPSPPALGSSGPVEVKKDRLDSMLKQARDMTEVSHSIPKFLRGLFRKQGGYNRALLDTVAALAKTNVQLNKRVQELQSAAQQQHDWIQILVERRQADADWMKTATPVIASFSSWQEQTSHAADEIRTLREEGSRASEHLTDLQHHVADEIRSLREEGSRAGEHLTDLQHHVADEIRSLGEEGGRAGEHLTNLQHHVADEIRSLREEGSRAGEHLTNLQHHVERQADRLTVVEGGSERAAEHLRNLQAGADATGEHLRNLQRTADRLLTLFDHSERATEHLRNLQTLVDRQAEYVQGLRGDTERHAEHLRNLQEQANTSGEHVRHLQDEAERSGEQLRDLRPMNATVARIETEIAHLAEFRRTLGRLEERHASDAVYLKGQLSYHATLLQQGVISPRGKRNPVTEAAPLPADDGAATDLDQFYLSFENRFRGTRAEIKERVRFYLPILKQAKAGTAARPILDVGCGRGEWLELLEENKLRASGVDLNTAMIAECTERKLTATLADAIAHLRSLRANTLGCVSGFHIIEHLPFATLLELFMQTRRVLKPGGVAIFESPNCKNLMVGACYFNVDPTHRNPVFPETASFIMETQGFDQVRLEYLSPATRPFTGADHDAEMLNDLLFGAQDFAVIGRKPAAQ